MLAGAGNDSLDLAKDFSSTTIRGGSGDDTIELNDVFDDTVVNGNDNSDFLSAAVGAGSVSSFVAGGKGKDTIFLDFLSGANNFTVNGGAGHDSVVLTAGSNDALIGLHVNGGNGFDTITFQDDASVALSGSFLIDGGDLADKITFESAVDSVVGTATIAGGGGADTISFNTKLDVNAGGVDAGAGNDSIFISGTFDRGTINGGAGQDTITLGTFAVDADAGVIYGDALADKYDLGSKTITRALSGNERVTGGSFLGYNSFDQSNLSAYDFASAALTLSDAVSGAGTLEADYLNIVQSSVVATVASNLGNPTTFTGTDGIATFTSTFSTELTARVVELDRVLTEGQSILFTASGGATSYLFVQGGGAASGTSGDLLVQTNVAANKLQVSASGTQLILGLTTAVA